MTTEEKQAEVIPIGTPTRQKGKGKKGPSKIEIVKAYCDVISASPISTMPPLGRTFHVQQDPTGIRSLLEEHPGEVVKFVQDSAMADLLVDYSHALPPGMELDTRLANEITKVWKARQRPIPDEEIAPVRELSEKGKCWRRLPWDLAYGETPTFDEMMQRTTNSTALMAFIGSLLCAESDRQQYVWIWGEGRNGKGSLAQFLMRVLGQSYRAEVVPKQSNSNFWTAGLLGSRLVVFADCTDYRFPATGLFKSLTGGDAVRIERKGKDPQTMELCCKFLFLSNARPAITNTIADKRRAIYCEMGELPPDTKLLSTIAYGALLDSEGAAWLYKCRAIYVELAGDHCPIPVDETALEEVIAASEEPLDEIFDRLFEVQEKGDEHERSVERGALRRILAAQFNLRNGPQQGVFNRYLERRGVKPIYRRDSGKGLRRLSGIVWKDEVWRNFGAVIRGELGVQGAPMVLDSGPVDTSF